MTKGIDINLGTLQGFTLAAAMRGPDSHTDAALILKNALTARLRYLATGASHTDDIGGYSINPDPVNDIDLETLVEAARHAKSEGLNVSHFLGHIEEGARSLVAILHQKSPSHRTEEAWELCHIANKVRFLVSEIKMAPIVGTVTGRLS